MAFVAGSTLEVKARQCATATNDGCTSIADISTLSMDGTLRLTLVDNHILKAGDSIRVWRATTMTGTPQLELPEGIEWDTSRLSEGLLFVSSVSDGIVQPTITMSDSPALYDLNGRLVRSDGSTEGLPAGIYVRRGKKIIVK